MRSQAFELAGSQLKIPNVLIVCRCPNPAEQAVAIGKDRRPGFG
jgi:hypothetical protein